MIANATCSAETVELHIAGECDACGRVSEKLFPRDGGPNSGFSGFALCAECVPMIPVCAWCYPLQVDYFRAHPEHAGRILTHTICKAHTSAVLNGTYKLPEGRR